MLFLQTVLGFRKLSFASCYETNKLTGHRKIVQQYYERLVTADIESNVSTVLTHIRCFDLHIVNSAGCLRKKRLSYKFRQEYMSVQCQIFSFFCRETLYLTWLVLIYLELVVLQSFWRYIFHKAIPLLLCLVLQWNLYRSLCTLLLHALWRFSGSGGKSHTRNSHQGPGASLLWEWPRLLALNRTKPLRNGVKSTGLSPRFGWE